jgi:hypothetical protein
LQARGPIGSAGKRVIYILLQMKHFLLILIVSIFLTGGAIGEEEISQEDLEIIEMLEFLDAMDLVEDSNFELLEGLTEMGEDDGS